MISTPIAIVWQARAKRQLSKLGKTDQVFIWREVGALATLPWGANVIVLKTHQYGFRLRAGRYRILFDFDGRLRVVSIEEVKKRDEQAY
ncbi:type II toxin-antitoxin system RelE family toxin [Pseudoduganella sp. R-43]|uniref:type II toxin-antitoxin system RelE family toxin n=1 Tax=unclassified Pseudoduganella TaxID=2637179 RepID=UPI003CF79973